jgi:hypothetical protein
MGQQTICLINSVPGEEAYATANYEAGAKALETVGFRRVDRETYRRWVAHCAQLKRQASKSPVRD